MFFFTASYNLIIPELNTFITALDGEDYKGYVIALFTLSALVARPFSGKLSDAVGRKKAMVVGILVCCIISLLYPLCYSVGFFLLLRFFHGFSTGFYPTGATALVTDIIPEEKRGNAMGLFGTFISLGIGFGQGICSPIVNLFGTNGLFVFSFGLVIVAFILFASTKETLKHPEKFRWSHFSLKADELVETKVFPVAIVMLLSSLCSGIIFVLTPDIAIELKIGNKGAFFICYVVSTILIRLFTGGLSDKYGRPQVLIFGISLLSISMLLIGFSNSIITFAASSVIFGIATGICSPTLFAWTADLSPNNRRGIGAGTMFIALELGISLGALLTNVIYKNNYENVKWVFVFGASSCMLTIIYLVWYLLRMRRNKKLIADQLV